MLCPFFFLPSAVTLLERGFLKGRLSVLFPLLHLTIHSSPLTSHLSPVVPLELSLLRWHWLANWSFWWGLSLFIYSIVRNEGSPPSLLGRGLSGSVCRLFGVTHWRWVASWHLAGMLLNILAYTGQLPQHRIIQPQMSVEQRLRNTDLTWHSGTYHSPRCHNLPDRRDDNSLLTCLPVNSHFIPYQSLWRALLPQPFNVVSQISFPLFTFLLG